MGQKEIERGVNKGKVVSMKIVCSLPKDTDVPLCFLVVDHKHNYHALSIYHMNKDISEKIKCADDVIVRNPHLEFITGEMGGKVRLCCDI